MYPFFLSCYQTDSPPSWMWLKNKQIPCLMSRGTPASPFLLGPGGPGGSSPSPWGVRPSPPNPHPSTPLPIRTLTNPSSGGQSKPLVSLGVPHSQESCVSGAVPWRVTQTHRTVPGSCGERGRGAFPQPQVVGFPTPKGGSETLGRRGIPGAPGSRGWSFLWEGSAGTASTLQKLRMPLGGDGAGCALRGAGPAGSTLQGGRPRGWGWGVRPAGRGNGRVKGFGLSPCLLSTPDWETEERPLEPRSPSKGERSRPRTVRPSSLSCPD